MGQRDYRANDRDGNKIQDYWREDIAGLYVSNSNGWASTPMRLIDISIAAADAAPVTNIAALTVPGPRAGWHFTTLSFVDEVDALDPDRFAVCAYPANYGGNFKETFIISHEKIIYSKDLGRPGGIRIYPTNPVVEGWERVN